MNHNPFPTQYIKINSKWIIHLKGKSANYKISKIKHRGKNLSNLELGKDVLNRTQKAQTLKQNNQ